MAGVSPHPTFLRRSAAWLLVAVMVVGGLMLWLGLPLGWIWVASQLTDTTAPTVGPYMLVAIAFPISMVLMAKGLRYVDSLHSHLIGRAESVRIQLPWLKSLRAERHTPRPTTALDVVLAVDACLAGIALLVWFLGFAGSPLPN